MHHHDDDKQWQYGCFQCNEGHVHMVCGNVTLTLNQSQFLALSEAMSALRNRIQNEFEAAIPEKASTHLLM
jgi:hypothetical protein